LPVEGHTAFCRVESKAPVTVDPFNEVDPHNDERLAPVERPLRGANMIVPRASVSAVELEVRAR
jgi:hypothetical protein